MPNEIDKGLRQWSYGDIIQADRMNAIHDNIHDIWISLQDIVNETGELTLEAIQIKYNDKYLNIAEFLDYADEKIKQLGFTDEHHEDIMTSLQNSINTLKDKKIGLGDIEYTNETYLTLEDFLVHLEAELKNTLDEMNVVEGDMRDIKEDYNNVTTDIVSNKNAIKLINSSIDLIKTDILTLQAKKIQASEVSYVSGTYVTVKEFLDYVGTQLKSLTTKDTELNSTMTAIKNAVETLQKKQYNATEIKYNNTTYTTVSAFLEYLESSIEINKEAIKTLQEAMGLIELTADSIEYIKGDCTNVADYLDYVDNTINDLYDITDTLENDKVDKEEGKSLISDEEIERLADVDNYDDTEVRELIDTKSDITYVDEKVEDINATLETKADKTYVDTELDKKADITYVEEKIGDIDFSDYAIKEEVDSALDTKVDKEEGKSLILDSEIERLSNVDNYDDTEVRGLIDTKSDKTHKHDELYATKQSEHAHSNQEVLESITQQLIDLWSKKLVIQYDEETMDLYIGLSEPDTIAYVEYIENTSQSYIDTGLYANYNWKYEIVVQDNAFSQYENYFGTNDANMRLLRNNYEDSLLFCYGAVNTHNYAITGKKVTICVDKNKLYIDDELIATATENASTTSFDKTLLLFQARYQNALDKYGVFKCYSFKAWNEDDTLVLDLRPCLDTENIACMYDEVSKRYLYNQGTGVFAHGNRINVGSKLVKDGLIANLCEFDVAGRKMIDTVGDYDLTVTGNESMVNTDNLFVSNASTQQGVIVLPMGALTKFTFSYVVMGNWHVSDRKQIICGDHASTFYMWLLSTNMNIYYMGTRIIGDNEYTTLAEDNARFIDVTLDVTNGHCCFYVNGELKVEKTGLTLNQATMNNLYLNNPSSAGSRGNFILYSFKVYNRCLSQEEIQKNIEYETKRLDW